MDDAFGLVKYELVPDDKFQAAEDYDLDKIIFDLNSKIDMLSSKADSLDYVIAVASGIVCGMLDILWTGDFDLSAGREVASTGSDEFVKRTAEMLGCKNTKSIRTAVKFLEDRFPIPSDGNTPNFGGGRQHHLRDFAHHPTIVGLAFSLLTQFTCKSYGTDVNGCFLAVDVPEKSRLFIGKDIPQKILNGTVIWFFHLVSDIAGSNGTAGFTGGTGIPGPILSLAKEISTIPFFKNARMNGKESLSVFLSKLFNGTLLAKHDVNGKVFRDTVLKIDIRGELGFGIEQTRQAIPVIANECIVKTFYFIRHLATEFSKHSINSIEDIASIDWKSSLPTDNPTLARMLTIATSVFTVLDVSDAVISQKYWVSVNYIGIGRFAVAIGNDVCWGLKTRDVKKVRSMYETIKQQTFVKQDADVYGTIGVDMDCTADKLGLTVEQIEILYNLEYCKTLHDINTTKLLIKNADVHELKLAWLNEWTKYISGGFASFTKTPGAEMHWYSEDELIHHIPECEPQKTWYRLALLEAMLFEPYYPLSLAKDKKGNDVPSRKYSSLQNAISGYKKSEGDNYLDATFADTFCTTGYIKRLRRCYDKCMLELNEVLKTVVTSLSVTAVITLAAVATAGALAPAIAVAVVGSNFAGLSGAALTSACLAYLGGGAVAIGGAGMAGGTIAVVGGGAALGLGVGAGIGGTVGAVGLMGKKNTILQSAKLLVSVREIFLNDEHDIELSDSIYEKYLQNISSIEKGVVDLQLKADVATGKEKKAILDEIKKANESVEAMKIARKNMLRFKSSFETGLSANNAGL